MDNGPELEIGDPSPNFSRKPPIFKVHRLQELRATRGRGIRVEPICVYTSGR